MPCILYGKSGALYIYVNKEIKKRNIIKTLSDELLTNFITTRLKYIFCKRVKNYFYKLR